MNHVAFDTPSTSALVEREAWEAFLVSKEEIDAEIKRLSQAPLPASGCRSSSFVHPRVKDGIPSFTPVTEVFLTVLNPGERTTVRRGNYLLLDTSILGGGRASIDAKHFQTQTSDVWTVPSMKSYYYENNTDEIWAWLSYSNAALLRRIGAYWAEDNLPEPQQKQAHIAIENEQYTRKTGPIHPLASTKAELRGYEHLTDIEPLPNPPLHWVWNDMTEYLPIHAGDNKDPNKRSIWLLYNPATERRQGTTLVHFACYTAIPPGMPPYAGDRGHFHTSASINYHRTGHGYSVVGGKRVDWKAGDLLLSAPSWIEHAHYFGDDGCTVLTVQDHPMHIALGALLWQENLNDPILSLGNEEGQKGYVFPREAGK